MTSPPFTSTKPRMKKILITGPSPSDELKTFMKDKGYEILSPGVLNEDEIIDALVGVDAYIPGGEEVVTERIIASAKNTLKVISFNGVGYGYYVDVTAAKKHNVAVTYVPHANSLAVAEFTVALILTLMKKIPIMNKETKSGLWHKYVSQDLSGKTIGIVGMGSIGRLVAKKMYFGFGSKILYYSRTRESDIEQEVDAEFVELHELCRLSDVITLHTPYTSETRYIIDEKCINFMNRDTVLINTARAELVSPIALRDALVSSKINAAAFDCYYSGKVPADTSEDTFGLMNLPDDTFILTPHAAYNTVSSNREVEKIALQNIVDIFTTGSCSNLVV